MKKSHPVPTMSSSNMKGAVLLWRVVVILAVFAALAPQPCLASGAAHPSPQGTSFPPDLQDYAAPGQSVLRRLPPRIEANP